MPRYGDLDALLRKLSTAQDGTRIPDVDCDNFPIQYSLRDLKQLLREFPTADVVEVVRCNDCIFHLPMEGVEYKGRKAMHCFNHSRFVREDGFCDDGIREE